MAELMNKVFVSATSEDLGSFRHAVSKTLIAKNVHPVSQETFEPDYRTVREVLRAKTSDCDAVICLVGKRFGQEPRLRSDDLERRSYTQLEFEIAVELKKPVFLFLASDNCQLDSTKAESAELVQLQFDYINRLRMSELPRNSFQSHADLAAQVALIRFDKESLAAHAMDRLVAVMCTDMVGSTALKRQLGDVRYVQTVLIPFDRMFRQIIAASEGEVREVSPRADGFTAIFESVKQAITAAIRFHDALQRFSWEHAIPKTRIAIHTGQCVVMPGIDAKKAMMASFTVDYCARVARLACGGQTLLTRAAHESSRQFVYDAPTLFNLASSAFDVKSDAKLDRMGHGTYLLKGDGNEPVEVWEIGLAGIAPFTSPPDSAGGQREKSAKYQKDLEWRPNPGSEIPNKPDWVLQERLGAGGFGEAWLAKNVTTGKLQVFKFCFEAERIQAIKRELTVSELFRRLGKASPDIAGPIHVNHTNPPFYSESEYISGGNLESWAKAQGGLEKVPLATRLRLIKELARALGRAHSVGIIHHDVKPLNVFMRMGADELWHPVLGDFGISVIEESARAQLEKHSIKPTGFTLLNENDSRYSGTPMYRDPRPGVATCERDVYSLGVILYQMLVGSFEQALSPDFEQHLKDQAIDIHGNKLWLLCKDIRECVHVSPKKRLGTAKELGERLESLDIRAKKRGRHIQLQRVAAFSRIAAIGLAIGLGAFSWRQWRLAEDAKQVAVKALSDAEDAQLEEKRLRGVAEGKQKEAMDSLLHVKKFRGNWHGQIKELARSYLDRGESELKLQNSMAALLSWVHAYKLLIDVAEHDEPISKSCQTSIESLADVRSKPLPEEGGAAEVHCSHDGRWIMTQGNSGTSIWDASTGRRMKFIPKDALTSCLSISDDGKLILTAQANRITTWDADTEQKLHEVELEAWPAESFISSLSFDTTTGGLLVVGFSSVRLYASEKGSLVWEIPLEGVNDPKTPQGIVRAGFVPNTNVIAVSVERFVTEQVEQTYTVTIPYTEMVDGTAVTRMRPETRTRPVEVKRIRRDSDAATQLWSAGNREVISWHELGDQASSSDGSFRIARGTYQGLNGDASDNRQNLLKPSGVDLDRFLSIYGKDKDEPRWFDLGDSIVEVAFVPNSTVLLAKGSSKLVALDLQTGRPLGDYWPEFWVQVDMMQAAQSSIPYVVPPSSPENTRNDFVPLHNDEMSVLAPSTTKEVESFVSHRSGEIIDQEAENQDASPKQSDDEGAHTVRGANSQKWLTFDGTQVSVWDLQESGAPKLVFDSDVLGALGPFKEAFPLSDVSPDANLTVLDAAFVENDQQVVTVHATFVLTWSINGRIDRVDPVAKSKGLRLLSGGQNVLVAEQFVSSGGCAGGQMIQGASEAIIVPETAGQPVAPEAPAPTPEAPAPTPDTPAPTDAVPESAGQPTPESVVKENDVVKETVDEPTPRRLWHASGTFHEIRILTLKPFATPEELPNIESQMAPSFSADGKTFVCAHGSVYTRWSPENRIFSTAPGKSFVLNWDAKSMTPQHRIDPGVDWDHLAVSASGQSVATVQRKIDKEGVKPPVTLLRIWNFDLKPDKTIIMPDEPVYFVQFLADEGKVLTVSAKQATVWDVATEKAKDSIDHGIGDGNLYSTKIAFCPVTKTLTIFDGEHLKYWKLEDATTPRLIETRPSKKVLGLRFSPNGDQLAIGYATAVDIVQLKTDKVSATLEFSKVEPKLKSNESSESGCGADPDPEEATVIRFLPDGKRILTGHLLWDIEEGIVVQRFRPMNQNSLTDASVFPDSSKIAFRYYGDVVSLLSVRASDVANADRVSAWSRWAVGWDVDERGKFQQLTADQRLDARAEFDKLGGSWWDKYAQPQALDEVQIK